MTASHYYEPLLDLEGSHYWEITAKLSNQRKHRFYTCVECVEFAYSGEEDAPSHEMMTPTASTIKYGEPGLIVYVTLHLRESPPLTIEVELGEGKERTVVRKSVAVTVRKGAGGSRKGEEK